MSGIAAARVLKDSDIEVILLESQKRLGGRINTDHTLGFPVDMGASWLHGACQENPIATWIARLGLHLYKTSGDRSVLFDHDLESCMLLDTQGREVPHNILIHVEELLKKILQMITNLRDEIEDDVSIMQAITMVGERIPELSLEGLPFEVLQWFLSRIEGWYGADLDEVSLKLWDEEHVIRGGHGVLVEGYDTVIKVLARDIDVRLNHRVTQITNSEKEVVVTVEDGRWFSADAAILTVSCGVLKANLIDFAPQLPPWKLSAITQIGMGNYYKIAMLFDHVFWPDVEMLGKVAPTTSGCSYFLNLHRATGQNVLMYMAAGRFATELEMLNDDEAASFVIMELKNMFPVVTNLVKYIVSRWGTTRDTLGCYAFDMVGMDADIYERLRAPVGNVFFAGEALSMQDQGCVQGAYLSGIEAAKNIMARHGVLKKFKITSFSDDLEFPLLISRK